MGDLGRLGPIQLQTDAHDHENAADLKQLKVRSANGDMIALDRIAKIRDVARFRQQSNASTCAKSWRSPPTQRPACRSAKAVRCAKNWRRKFVLRSKRGRNTDWFGCMTFRPENRRNDDGNRSLCEGRPAAYGAAATRVVVATKRWARLSTMTPKPSSVRTPSWLRSLGWAKTTSSVVSNPRHEGWRNRLRPQSIAWSRFGRCAIATRRDAGIAEQFRGQPS